jgi:proteasome lid subunit RPN8/RPN11
MTKISFGEIQEIMLPKEVFPLAASYARNSVKLTLDSFRVYILESVISKIENHLFETADLESGGILIGHPFEYINNSEIQFTVVTDAIRINSGNRGRGHYTVDPQGIAAARHKIPDGLLSVGWYHSHPGHGVFLSGADLDIMKIYSSNWQIAFVLDTHSNNRGFFHGRTGKRVGNPYYLSAKPACIEAVVRYNCAVAAMSGGNDAPLKSFVNWIKANPVAELAHWVQSGRYQDIVLENASTDWKQDDKWDQEFERAVNFYNSGRPLPAKEIFDKLFAIRADPRITKYLKLLEEGNHRRGTNFREV